MSKLRQKMVREMELREFSVNTQKACLAAVEELVRFYRRPPDKIVQQEIEDYLLYLKKKIELSYSTRNQITSGLKFFYNQALKKDDIKLELPSKTGQKKLPEVLSTEEVSRLINASDNLKHRVLLKMTYGGRLRLSEVIRLKPQHIDSFYQLKTRLWSKSWVVDVEHPLENPDHVIEYVGRYTHRVAIANHRILDLCDGKVTFSYKNRKKATIEAMTIDGVEFIRRFLLHVFLVQGHCGELYLQSPYKFGIAFLK